MAKIKKALTKWMPKVTINDAKRKLPISLWLPEYNLDKLQGDIIAGLAVGLMSVPQSLAVASLIGLSPEHGLYSSFPGVFVYALLGSAKDVNVGPTVILALMTKQYISFASSPLIASTLAFLSGIVLSVLGIFKLGFVVRFVSIPVINGFVSAAAIVVAMSQIKDMLGLKNVPRPFFKQLVHIFTNLKNTVPGDACMGIICLIVLIGLQIISKRQWRDETAPPTWKVVCRKLLWIIILSRSALVTIFATLVAYIFHLNGIRTAFSLSGQLPKGLPPFKPSYESVYLFGNKTFYFKDVVSEFGAGLGIMPLIMLLESFAVAKALSTKNKYKIDPSQELIALGIGNIFGSFFTGFPVTGALGKSALNSISGAKTPFSSIVAGCIVLLATVFLTPAFQYIPKAALGAMIFAAVVTLIEVQAPRKLWKISCLDLLPYTVSFLGSFFELEIGILAGTGVAIMIILQRAVKPKIVVRTEDEGSTVSLNINGGVWFPGAEDVTEKLISLIQDSECCPTVIRIDCSSMHEIDYTVATALRQTITDVESMHVAMTRPTISFVNVRERHVQSMLQKVGLISGSLEMNGKDEESRNLIEQNNLELSNLKPC